MTHRGSIAHDFNAAFGLGGGDGPYSAVDAHGVALAAIQALKERVDRQHERIERLEMEHRNWRR